MGRSIQVLILAEDLRQSNFVKHFLQERNVPAGRIRILPLPAGKGSGFDYVIREYPKELQSLRRSGSTAGLIVVIDADDKTVDRRLSQLRDALEKTKIEYPHGSECVGIVVPRRNIETWIYHLQGNVVNEEENYKQKVEDWEVLLSARRLATDCPDRLLQSCPASLRHGCHSLNDFRHCIQI
jgi:hypothetical protein